MCIATARTILRQRNIQPRQPLPGNRSRNIRNIHLKSTLVIGKATVNMSDQSQLSEAIYGC